VLRQLKPEGGRKSFLVALYLLIQMPDLYSVEFGKIGVEDNPLSAKNKNFRIDFSRNHDCCFRHNVRGPFHIWDHKM
jgi:hypothetical protein